MSSVQTGALRDHTTASNKVRMKHWLNGLLSVCGLQLVRKSTIEGFRAKEDLAATDPVAATREVLEEISNNRLTAGTALLAVLKDIRVAAQFKAAASSAEWLYSNADRAPTHLRRTELLEAVVPLIPTEGDLVEFGVFKGAVTWFLRPRFPNRTYHAFDSWKGVPEGMSLAVSKFGFDLGGEVPDLPADTTIHIGWFEDTLPRWREQFHSTVAFAYIDCDLYESVRTVLEGLADRAPWLHSGVR